MSNTLRNTAYHLIEKLTGNKHLTAVPQCLHLLIFETVELYYIKISVHGPPPIFIPRPVHVFVTPGYMYLLSSISL